MLFLQSGRPVVAESRKKMPFEPESMKLDVYVWPLNTVAKLARLSSVKIFADPSALLLCVPMPNVIVPDIEAAPPVGTVGS